MSELICDDCPLKSMLKNIGELAELMPTKKEKDELNELVINSHVKLGRRALASECDGSKIMGTVCGLDRYAELNNEIGESFIRIMARKP